MRRTLLFTAACLTGLVLISGCGETASSTTSSTTTPQEPSGDGPLVEMSKSGGISYYSVKLTIEPSGEATFRHEGSVTPPARGGKPHFELTDGELARVEQVLTDHPIDELQEPEIKTACADCFSYRLEYGDGSYERTDADAEDPNATAVFAVLDDVLEAHTYTINR